MEAALEIPASVEQPLPRCSTTARKSPWTRERLELLGSLISKGLTASQIAAALGGGISRNAVIGKLNRLDLRGVLKAGLSEDERLRRRRQTVIRHRAQRAVTLGMAQRHLEESAAPPPGKLVKLAKLKAGQCRFIPGDPEDLLYCGAAVVSGGSWCDAHRLVVFDYGPRRRR